MQSLDKDKWIEAMYQEYQTLVDQEVWSVYEKDKLPGGRKPVELR